MHRRWGKRGLEDKFSFTMWEIMVIVMVVVVLTMSVRAVANNTTYWKKYHSTDLALMTDLLLTNQGDFNINYNLKEIHPNIVTKTLRIKPLIFQISLKEDAFFVYDKSSKDDRFPQSYVFARDSERNEIRLGSTTNEYITLKKEGTIITIDDEYVVSTDSCPSDPTKGDTSKKHFVAIALSDSSKDYATQINSALTRYSGTEEEMHIFLVDDSTKAMGVIYNPTQQIKSGKMSCLIRKNIISSAPQILINVLPYSGEFDSNSLFTTDINNQNQPYNYWIIIRYRSTDISKVDLSKAIIAAIDEYYR